MLPIKLKKDAFFSKKTTLLGKTQADETICKDLEHLIENEALHHSQFITVHFLKTATDYIDFHGFWIAKRSNPCLIRGNLPALRLAGGSEQSVAKTKSVR